MPAAPSTGIGKATVRGAERCGISTVEIAGTDTTTIHENGRNGSEGGTGCSTGRRIRHDRQEASALRPPEGESGPIGDSLAQHVSSI